MAGDDRPVSVLRTPFCRELGIDYPIWSVGFGAGAGPELAAAVSNAGGFGVLGASGLPADAIRRLVARTRDLTERPFGVNDIRPAGAIVRDLARDAEAALR